MNFDPVNYTGDFTWNNIDMSCTPMTPEDLDTIDRVCSEFDWVRVADYNVAPAWWANRIGPRSGFTPQDNHETVVNCLTLAGFSFKRDGNWPGIPVYYIYKP